MGIFFAKFLDGKDANEQTILIRGYEATAIEEYIFTILSRFGGEEKGKINNNNIVFNKS